MKIYGDVMLDKWIEGDVTRISPEAPVPVLKEVGQSFSLGGAANLANNFSSLKVGVNLWGAVSTDDAGFKFLELLKEKSNIDASIKSDSAITTVKTRLVDTSGHHIMRWDKEQPYRGVLQKEFLDSVRVGDYVIVSDYDKGAVTQSFMQKLLGKTYRVFVDPKQEVNMYKDVYCIKPNMKEYESWFGKFNVAKAKKMCDTFNWKYLVVTDGSNGVHIITESTYDHHKEPVKEVADVTGAGDTFLAVMVYCYVDKQMTMVDACKTACYASARIVEKRGVATVTLDDLNRGVVWTNGVFDILHTGHLELLKFARAQGNKLIVGINDDASVGRLKGAHRPINKLETRIKQLETLPWVDEVKVFSEDTPLSVIEQIGPDKIVKGGDYTVDTVVGNELAEVIIFPTIEGASTTNIVDTVQERQ